LFGAGEVRSGLFFLPQVGIARPLLAHFLPDRTLRRGLLFRSLSLDIVSLQVTSMVCGLAIPKITYTITVMFASEAKPAECVPKGV
jgi:hypothetical protein